MEPKDKILRMTKKPYNYTIRGKTDGFGCQYNAILSGIAFCEHDPNYNYIHTPFYSVSHGWGWEENEPESSWKKRTDELNEFIGIPYPQEKQQIDKAQRFNKTVFNDNRPSNWYDDQTLKKIRKYYWSTPKPSKCEQDIVVHIRRGDVQPDGKGSDRRKRYTANEWYGGRIPWVASMYPESYTIAIHSEGEMDEFESIMDDWPTSLIDRTTWKLGKYWKHNVEFDLKRAFHDMVTSKVLVQSKSAFSYVAGILSEGDVFYYSGNKQSGQRYPLDNWRVMQHSSSKHEDGITYKEIINIIEQEA